MSGSNNINSKQSTSQTAHAILVSLREINKETVRAVTKLSVAENQQRFVAPNAVSLSEALFSDEAWYRAVYNYEELVGFVMLSDESIKKDPPAEPNIGLWRLMIDQRYQGRGIGREVMRLVLDYVKSRPRIRYFYTSYVPEPGGPGPFYLSLGFAPNGEIEDGEIIVVYPLQNN